MKLALAISLLLICAGCVTTDDKGNPIGKSTLETDLVVDSYGRIVGRPTRLVPPHTIIVNGDKPTEREIRLLGVEGLPESEAPNTYAECQEWMARFLAAEDEIFIKPSLDSRLDAPVIFGLVYLRAYDEETQQPVPNGYVLVNMAMLSKGLVRIRNLNEIEDSRLRDSMQEAETRAKREKLGLWSRNP
jgi:endonuclease YncB( thermonuclease family)